MGKPYADDLRMVAVRLIEEGHTRPEVAELCGISLSSVGRYLRRFRTNGGVSPDKFGGYKGYAPAKHADRVKRWIAEQPDMTLLEIQERLAEAKVKVAASLCSRVSPRSARAIGTAPPPQRAERGQFPPEWLPSVACPQPTSGCGFRDRKIIAFNPTHRNSATSFTRHTSFAVAPAPRRSGSLLDEGHAPHGLVGSPWQPPLEKRRTTDSPVPGPTPVTYASPPSRHCSMSWKALQSGLNKL
jgi:transposase